MAKEEVVVLCTYCNAPLKMLASDVDRIVKCPNCKRFNKIQGQTQKRMELSCPLCSTVWNLPLKMRGKIYSCWKCQTQTQIPEPPKLNFEEIAMVEEIEQGMEQTEIIFKISNSGMPAILNSISINFENNLRDVSTCYTVTPSQEGGIEVDYTAPVELSCAVGIASEAPTGLTKLHIRIEGSDALEGTPIGCEGTVDWVVLPKRIFIIQTEHSGQEKVATPFAVQLWACLANGDTDPTYQGSHSIQLDTSATVSAFDFPPTVPKTLRIEFQNGRGATGREFILYNALERPKIIAWEDALGGPEGESEGIVLQPGELDTFDIVLTSPQWDFSPFRGENKVRAVDKYGNIVRSFKGDAWIYPASNTGEIFAPGFEHNVIPATAFSDGVADLTQLGLMYILPAAQKFPKEESFIVSYDKKEGTSKEIILELNPIKALIQCHEVPERVEQGQKTEFGLNLTNLSPDDYVVSVVQVECHFFQNFENSDQFYQLRWQNEGVECPPGGETTLLFAVEISDAAPTGIHDVQFIIYIQDTRGRCYSKNDVRIQWHMEPKGRVFQLLSPDPKIIRAGKKFDLEVGAYFEGEMDTNYSGKRVLQFTAEATPSPGGAAPEIPGQLEVMFENGIARTPTVFCFTNAGEKPALQIDDPAPGGARSSAISFTVRPAELDSFLVRLQEEQLVNTRKFGEQNKIIARDSYGNTKVDFAADCTIFSASQKGKIYVRGKEGNVIPAQAFRDGVADLGEWELAYYCDVQDKLPKQEEFVIQCANSTGRSKALTILPRPAEIQIVRCSAPKEIELGEHDYPIYLELENVGDLPATISSCLITFSQQEDVSSNYTLLASPANTAKLIPCVPLQLSYTVKAGPKTPLGLTQVEVKVTGIETETSAPLQARAIFEWMVEGGLRVFQVSTAHGQREQAGVAFHLRIEARSNNERDPRYAGEKVLKFECNATPTTKGKKPNIPDRLTLNFHHGEAGTPSRFTLVNNAEIPIIRVIDTSAKIEGQTEPIEVMPGPLAAFEFKIKSSLRDKENFDGRNTITAVDAYSNVIQEFDKRVEMTVQGVRAHLVDAQKRRIKELPGEWFRKGVVNLSDHKVAMECEPDQVLPAQAVLMASCTGVDSTSEPVEILPRPIKVAIEHVESEERVVEGESYPVHVVLLNDSDDSDAKIEVKAVDFTFSDGRTEYEFPFEEGDNPTQIGPGKHTLSYLVSLTGTVPYGKISGKVALHILCRQDQMSLEGNFDWQVEPAGRTFAVVTENNQQQTAGIPFALRLKTILDNALDATYEGMRTISFKGESSPSPSGQAARIPKTLKVKFRQGEATTEQSFTLFNASEAPSIEASENMPGGAIGTSPAITVRAGALGKFEWKLHSPQFNAAAFEGENFLIAVDAYGNVKRDFQEDIRIQTESQKGDIQVAGANLLNMIPGHAFHEGKADLTSLGFRYQITQPEYLPIKERLIASYGDKRGESEPLRIQPRPLEFTIEEVSFPDRVFQDERDVPLVIAVKNTGDSVMQIMEVTFQFRQDEEDISELFITETEPGNVLKIEPEKQSSLKYKVEVSADALIGPVDLEVCGRGKIAYDEKSQQVAYAKSTVSFKVLEKLREFAITTEHHNIETAGEPFKLKIVAFKDGKEDTTYEGAHKIQFAVCDHEENRFLSYPKGDTIQFSRGVGYSNEPFILANAEQKPTITAEEKEKARGKSEKITVKAGILHSLKIVFDEKKSGINYNLQLLDKCDNVLEKDYKIDDQLKPGVILSGTGGAFYEIQEIVGHGAMGKVYKGKRLNDNLTVAIKTMLFSTAFSDIGRFLLEGHMLIKFDHPNIVKGYDLRQLCSQEGGKVESKFFMVMEYLPGQSVKDLMDASPEGYLPYRRATEIIVQVGRALAYIWEHQVIHRDIKPDNIQITEDGRVKLIDLGIVRAEGGMVDISLTQSDTVVGSYPYIAPERLKDGSPIDYRSDVYSLGATYYHMITGLPPFLDGYKGGGGRDLLDYMIRVRTKKMPTPPNKLVSDIPKCVSDGIMVMLNLRSNKRCETPQDLVAMLEKVVEEVKGG